jgi:transcriptional regulator with XRE-family HTH domain
MSKKKTTMKSSYSTKLKELRVAANYTQDYVASFLGIVRQTYSHYETGKRTPGPEVIYKLAGLYNMDVADLMHLCIELDEKEFYDAPSPSQESMDLGEYLTFINKEANRKKYSQLSDIEKQLVFYYGNLTKADQQDIMDFLKIKYHRDKSKH